MAGKRYSAGAIFLQVVPVFANVQRAIEDEAKNIDRALGDQMEKSGEKAGQRAGKAASKAMTDEMEKGSRESSTVFEREFRKSVDGINKMLGEIDIKRLPNDVRKELSALRKEAKALGETDLFDDKSLRSAESRLHNMVGDVQRINDNSKIVFKDNFNETEKGLARLISQIDRFKDPIDVEVRTGKAERALGAFEAKAKKSLTNAMKALGDSGDAEINRLKKKMAELSDEQVGITISAGAFDAEMKKISAQLYSLSRRSVDIDVKVNSGKALSELIAVSAATRRAQNDARGYQRVLGGLGLTGDGAANSFRSFNAVLLGVVSIGPAAIPILGGIAAGLLAIGPAAAVGAAGLGSVLIGFSGVGDAMKAMEQQSKSSALTAQTAGRSEASAARQVANARRSAAKQIESALDRQSDAQKRYQDSIKDVAEAEAALRDAREAAKDDGQDIERRIRGNQLAIDQALLNSFDATVNFNAVQSDGSSSRADREQARIDMEEAKLRLEELRAEQKELADEKAKWDKQGVDGADDVKDAQKRLTDAIEQQQEAYEDLRDAAEGVDEARAEGAHMVADALDQQAVSAENLTSQQNALNDAMSKLGPAGQEFSTFLYGLRAGFRDLRDDIQSVMLPSVQEAIAGFLGSANGSIARQALVALGAAFGEFALMASRSFQSPAFEGFFKMLRDTGPVIFEAFGRAFLAFGEAMASVMTTLAPYAVQLADAFASLMERFAAWAASPEGQKQIQEFMDWAVEIAPKVIGFFTLLASALLNIAVALAPYAETVLAVISGLLEFISEMDPQVLGAILTGVTVIMLAMQMVALFQNILLGASLIFTPIGAVIFAIIAVGAALAILYNKNKDFRDFVTDAWDRISKVFKKSWEEDIKPALERLGVVLKDLWDDILQPFFEWLGPILVKFAEVYFPMLAKQWGIAVDAIAIALRIMKMNFENTVSAIRTIWTALKAIFATPIAFLIETVFNDGIVAGFNKIASFVGMDKRLQRQELPKAIREAAPGYATGGILPGYTPGRDVHDFYSPTAGRLKLSGGEAIMRPEWTAAVGSGFVDFMNGAAQRGGVNGVRKALSAYFGGDAGVDAAGRPAAFATGGILTMEQIARAQKFVQDHDYAKYKMGAVGPDMFDCSGLIAAATNTIHGIKNVYQRLGSTGTFPWSGFKRGYGQFTVGSTPNYGNSGVGHMAGTLGGMNIESRSGDGVVYGPRARGYNDRGFTQHYYLGAGVGSKLPGGGTVAGNGGTGFPNWIVDIAKNPIGYVKSLVTGPIDKMKKNFGSSDMIEIIAGTPGRLVQGVADKVLDILPGPLKAIAGTVGRGIELASDGVNTVVSGVGSVVGNVGDALGFADGGILPYNGTMKYDNGGYLPPGLTSVVNLTGKPEPVFTSDQWRGMEGGAPGAGTIHYEPHFEGSDLTANDVAGDMNFQFRRLRRGGKYQGVGTP